MLQTLFLAQGAKKTASKGNFVSGLILVPTRELAVQVADSVKSYSANFNGAIKTVAVFGGVSVNTQMQALRGGADIIVASRHGRRHYRDQAPGRVQRRVLSVHNIHLRSYQN